VNPQPQPDWFPTKAILVPPIGSLFCVCILHLIIGDQALRNGGLGPLIIVLMEIFLWLAPLVELVAFAIAVIALWRGRAAATAMRMLSLAVGFVYLAANAWGLARA